MNVELLKAKILDLAIHGKLVPQLDSEPAVEQFGEIPDEIPFEIPGKWKWVKINNICDICRGGSPRPIKAFLTTASNGINWIKIGDAEKGSKYISRVAEKIIPEGVKKSRFITKGTLIISNSMSFGFPYILKVDGCIHDGWLAFSKFENHAIVEFLYFLLLSQYCNNYFKQTASGSTVKNLNIDKVKGLSIPLPPIEEQHRIIAKINELFSILDAIDTKQKSLEEKLKLIKNKALDLAIHGKLVPQLDSEPAVEQIGEAHDEIPFEIPGKWKWTFIDSLINQHKGGGTPARSISKYWNGNIPWASVKDLKGDFLYQTQEFISEEGLKNSASNLIPANSIIVCMRMALGKICINKIDIAINQDLRALFLKPIVDKYFFLNFYKTQQVSGNGITVKGIKIQDLLSTNFPLPPIEEQHRIVAKINEIFSFCDKAMELLHK